MNRIEPDNSAGDLGPLDHMWVRPPGEDADLGMMEVERYFTQGQCHAFALAVHELTGWPVYVSGVDGMFSIQGDDPMKDGNHAFVVRPDGMVVDIRGEMPLDDFVANWDHDYYHQVQNLPEDFYDSGWYQFDMPTAREWAPRLLATL